jgi:chromosome segregation ATPase
MDRIFIEQAKNIRREYIKNVREVAKCESEVEKYRTKLLAINEELHDIDEDTAKLKLVEIEINMKKIESIITPYTSKLTKLEEDADKLFENIKQRHPELSMEQIQNELIPYLTEINY